MYEYRPNFERSINKKIGHYFQLNEQNGWSNQNASPLKKKNRAITILTFCYLNSFSFRLIYK